jgi:hypothetical protein
LTGTPLFRSNPKIGNLCLVVPTISEFFRIVIRMYFSDHPPPHFHAYYGEAEAVYTIQTLEILDGGLLRRAHTLVLEWASASRVALMANWNQPRQSQSLSPISPLE